MIKLERIKPWLDFIQSIGTIVALGAGYIWFVQQRSNKPNIKLDETVMQRPIGSGEMILVTLDVRATNIGKVKVDLKGGTGELITINPPAESGKNPERVPLELRSLFLEPGESDQAIFRTFEVPKAFKTLEIDAMYPVPESGFKRKWTLFSAIDLGPDEPRKQAASSMQ